MPSQKAVKNVTPYRDWKAKMTKPTRKPAPLYNRLRTKYFDLKHTVETTKVKAMVRRPIKKTEDTTVDVPVTLGFDWSGQPVGRVRITKEAAKLLKAGMVLSPAYETEPEHKLIGFGLIAAANAVPPKDDEAKPEPPHYSGFLFHLFLIAVVSGLLAIIALIIRLFYIKS